MSKSIDAASPRQIPSSDPLALQPWHIQCALASVDVRTIDDWGRLPSATRRDVQGLRPHHVRGLNLLLKAARS